MIYFFFFLQKESKITYENRINKKKNTKSNK
jgi:hypothetical protein